jgi:DNA polymerase III alpha subunit
MWTDNSVDNLIEGVLRHGPEVLNYSQTTADITQYVDRITKEYLDYPTPKSIKSSNWFIPKEYQNLDIAQWLLDQCKSAQETDRVLEELELYYQHNMVPVLSVMKYIVDTLRANNVLWGVGRGSSVSSYCLYLIGIHKINSIKYNLPLEEFFKGDQNG